MGNKHGRFKRDSDVYGESSPVSSFIRSHRLQKSSSDVGPATATLRRHSSLEHWYLKGSGGATATVVRHRSTGSLMTRPRANTATSLKEEAEGAEEAEEEEEKASHDGGGKKRTNGMEDPTTKHIHLSSSSKRSSQHILPDEDELDLVNRMHATLRYVIGNNYIVPLGKPRSILDVGTGAGTWLMEVAMEWPDAACVGIDKSSQFPTTVMPKNCTFYVLDIAEEPGLSALATSFDFVHCRFLATSMPAESWSSVCRDLLATTAVEGVLQMTEFAFQLESVGPAGHQINQLLGGLADYIGIDVDAKHRLTDMLTQAGFFGVNCITVSLPCGDWGGHVGRLFQSDFLAQLAMLKPLLLDIGLTNEIDFTLLITEWQNEVDTSRCYGNVFIHTAHR
ncbi:S-adenosyl-L-methionine-dependent methyltransferase [Syncephalis fuscata]|nr:S-adenosyl-L-methionine-dependent methyltransferase [Syncephalis fuscata]